MGWVVRVKLIDSYVEIPSTLLTRSEKYLIGLFNEWREGKLTLDELLKNISLADLAYLIQRLKTYVLLEGREGFEELTKIEREVAEKVRSGAIDILEHVTT